MALFETQGVAYRYNLNVDVSLPKPDIPTLEPAKAGGGMAGLAGVAPLIGGAVSDIVETIGSYYIQKEHARAQKAITDANARIAKMQAQDAKERGHSAIARFRMKGKKVLGSQIAAMAASGIRIDFGSAQDVIQETMDVVELEVLTIKNNAAREALGYLTRADAFTLRGELIDISGKARRRDTLLAGGIRALGTFEKWRRS